MPNHQEHTAATAIQPWHSRPEACTRLDYMQCTLGRCPLDSLHPNQCWQAASMLHGCCDRRAPGFVILCTGDLCHVDCKRQWARLLECHENNVLGFRAGMGSANSIGWSWGFNFAIKSNSRDRSSDMHTVPSTFCR